MPRVVIERFAKPWDLISPHGFDPHSFHLFSAHFIELRFRFIYFSISWLMSVLIWFSFLPDLFLLSPFAFLSYQWDETLLTLLYISIQAASLASCPFFLWHIYLFLKPALLPRELSVLYIVIIWSAFIFSVCLIAAPFLLFRLPYFFLSFQSDTLVFFPTFNAIALFLSQILAAFFAIWAIPFLAWSNFNRWFLYVFFLFFAAIFSDLLSFFLVFLPLFLVLEASYFSVILVKLYLNSAYFISAEPK